MAVLSLLYYGPKTWVLQERGYSIIQAAGMIFLRDEKGYCRIYHIAYKNIKRELVIFSVNKKINEYGEEWCGVCE